MGPQELLEQYYEISDSEVERELVRRKGLHEFARLAWPEVDPAPFQDSWHLREIAKHYEAVSAGELKRLMVTIPPGCTKSMMTSVLWPAWDWIANPERKWLVATFDDKLMYRDSDFCRDLVSSEWYQKRWGHLVQIDNSDLKQTTKSAYSTTRGGRRVSITSGLRSRGTGWHSDIQIIDDPHKAGEVEGDPKLVKESLDKMWRWFNSVMGTRATNLDKFARVIIMQRLHEDDLVGRILNSQYAKEWTHVMFPMQFEPDRRCKTYWGADLRTEPGELLVPQRMSIDALKRVEMTERVKAAQFQQRPAPAEGNLLKREWFSHRWKELPESIHLIQSWDCAFKDTAESDFVAGHVWGFAKGKFYLVDRVHARMGMPETVRAIEAMSRKWPRARGKLIEDAANGPAIEQTLRHRMTGIIMMKPADMGPSKFARVNAIAALCEAGNVILPDPEICPWVDEVFEELVTFPGARHDDDVDATTQALIHLNDKTHSRYLDAMNRVAKGEIRVY